MDKLVKAHGDNLVSVILYGSSAEPEARDRLSDYNVLAVLREVTTDALMRSEPAFRWWREMKNPAPVLMSTEEVRTSGDSFPLEFSDIRERRRVLHGTDVFTDIQIEDRFYRAQLEHELRAKMLRLRQKAAGVLTERDLLMRLLCESVSTFCVLFRHALRLTGHEPVYAKAAVIAAAARQFGIAAEPFETVLAVREGKRKVTDIAEPRALFTNYLEQICRVVTAVDQIVR